MRQREVHALPKVRKALPAQYSYITQELTHEDSMNPKKSAYVGAILDTIIDTGQADDFIIAICETIQRLALTAYISSGTSSTEVLAPSSSWTSS